MAIWRIYVYGEELVHDIENQGKKRMKDQFFERSGLMFTTCMYTCIRAKICVCERKFFS